MSLTTAVAIYFIIWWLTLFVILPFGIRSQQESGAVSEGTDPGAPVAARLWARLIWTTVVSGVVFAVFALVYIKRWATLDDMIRWFDLTR